MGKESFSTNPNVYGLAYTTVTRVYRNGILETMYATAHRDTGKKGPDQLGDPIHVVFENPKSLEYNESAQIRELQSVLGLPPRPASSKEQSLPSA